ncbi:MAG: hypothetical protein V7641_3080 [Blastocatellia bacterium]
MSNDDPTRRLDGELPETPPTQPTIDTVLQRILELGTRLEQKIDQSEERLRQEINKNFREMEWRLDVMSVDINKLRARMMDLETSVRQLDAKPA